MSEASRKKKYRSMRDDNPDPVIIKPQREAFSVVRYKLDSAQVAQAIELYLTKASCFVDKGAQYEVTAEGAMVTSWFLIKEKDEPND